jgi:endonuclease YncB( thermonuclease family)
MKRIPVLGLCALALVAWGGLTAVQAETFNAQVIAVLDGDTVLVKRPGRRPFKVRLAEVDAPELAQPFGAKSRQFLSDQVGRREVRVEVVATDKYGRLVAHLARDGRSINRELVRCGMAWEYSRFRRHSAGLDLQREARQARRGLWGQPRPQPPWEWRKAHPSVRSGKSAARAESYVCGRKRLCTQMSSCDEAHYFLSRCGLRALDSDGDGVPCPVLCLSGRGR